MKIEGTFALEDLKNFEFPLYPGDRIWLEGDLWSGKTAFVKTRLARAGVDPDTVKSPTYVYCREYGDFHHYDLYRIEDYETFVNIGGEEILDDPKKTVFVEWPEILSERYVPTVVVRLEKTENESLRKMSIDRKSLPKAYGKPE